MGMGGGFMQRLILSSVITRLCRVVEESLYCLLQLDVNLCSGENLAYPSDVVLQEVSTQGGETLE